MLFSDPTSQGEPKACSVGLSRGYKRVEQRLADRSRYTWTIVQYRDVEPLFRSEEHTSEPSHRIASRMPSSA